MTDFDLVLKSLNQLIALVAGRDGAVSTNHLADAPLERVSELLSKTSTDLSDAAISGNQKEMKQAQRKLESLSSLRVLATVLIQETEWD